jgi:hypothetical protein
MTILSAFALSACVSAGDPRDAWLGVYDGSWLNEARDCSTGAALEPLSDSSFTIEIIESGSGDRIAIDGRCLIEYRVIDATHARIVPSACDFAGSDGTPLHVDYTGGSMELDGDEVSYDISSRLASPGACDTSLSTFVGVRR